MKTTGRGRETRYRFRMRQVVAGVFICVIVIGARSLLHYLNTPASAALVTGPSTSASDPVSQATKPAKVIGGYASFSYPSSLISLKRQQPNSGSTLASYGYEYRAQFPWQLVVTINYLSGGLANNDGAFYAMTQNPTRYQKIVETINGNAVTVMNNVATDGFSKVAFLFHGDYSADIAVTGTSQQYAEQEQMALDQVVQTWNWR